MTILFNVYEVLISFIEYFILYLFLLLCYPSIRHRFFPTSIISCIFLALLTLASHPLSIPFFIGIFLLLALPPIFMWFSFRIPIVETLSLTSFCFLCISTLDYLNLLFLTYVTTGSYYGLFLFQEMSWSRVINITVMKVILIILYFLIKVACSKNLPNTKHLKYLYLISIPGYLILYYLGLKIHVIVERKVTFEFIGLFFIGFAICILIMVYWIYQKQHKEMTLIHLSNTLLIKNYAELQNLYENRAKDFHDYKHHLNTLHYLAEAQNSEAVLQYIENLYGPLQLRESTRYSNNQIVNCILNTKHDTAKVHHISFEVNAEIPQELSIASTDLCIILSNVLDNAIEANMQIASWEMRWIKILIRLDHHMLYLVVKNAYQKQPTQNILSTSKQDRQLHGWGIKSIQSTLKKYDGHAEYLYKDTHFEVKISLNSFQ